MPVAAELLSDWLRDPNYHHGFLMPLVSIYFLWRDRAQLRAAPPNPSHWGLLGILGSLGLFVFGVAGAEVFTQRISLLGLLASITLFVYGWRRLRIVAFPIAFLFLAIPLPYVIYYGLTAPMQALAAKIAVVGLKGVGVQAVVQGNVIHLAQTSLEVAEACSGIRSLYAFLAAGALMAYTTAVPWWARSALFLSAIPISVAGNAVRVWGSGIAAWLIGIEATEGLAHELFGLFVFFLSLALFAVIKKVVKKPWSSARSSSSSSSPSPGFTPPGFERDAPLPAGSPTSGSSRES